MYLISRSFWRVFVGDYHDLWDSWVVHNVSFRKNIYDKEIKQGI